MNTEDLSILLKSIEVLTYYKWYQFNKRRIAKVALSHYLFKYLKVNTNDLHKLKNEQIKYKRAYHIK